MSEKKYTKSIYVNEKTSQFGNFFNIDIKTTDFIEFLKENTNAGGYCKLTFYRAKEGGVSKNTHYGVVNEFVPTMKPKEGQTASIDDNSNDLPF